MGISPCGCPGLGMKKIGTFFYLQKVFFYNLLFALFVLATEYFLLDLLPSNEDFRYYFGVLVLVGLFLDFAGIYYKTQLLYSFAFNHDRKIPFYFGLTLAPRLIFNGGIFLLAISAMGWLKDNDFWLLPATVLASMKEFWVRSTLLNPRESRAERSSVRKIWMGEIFLYLSMCISYLGLWFVFLKDADRLLLKAMYPQNYPFVALIFLLFLLSWQMPNLLEEYFRNKHRDQKIFALLSLLLPILALLFVFFKRGYLDH